MFIREAQYRVSLQSTRPENRRFYCTKDARPLEPVGDTKPDTWISVLVGYTLCQLVGNFNRYGHRPVVDQLDPHHGPELAGFDL